MILFWISYYTLLFFICYIFTKFNKNKFINYFFTPILLGVFGSVWFTNPGTSALSPIIAILFLELSIIEPNGLSRLIRPMISFIFFFEMMSFFIYIYNKRVFKKK